MYRKNRGGYSRFLNLYCEHCGNHVLLYQKDGPGPLKRLYLDRIFAPENLSNLQKTKQKNLKNLECNSCRKLIGTPSMYNKEKRKAFILFSYSVIKKVGTGLYPPKNKSIDA